MAGKRRGNGEGTIYRRLIRDKVTGEVLDERWEGRVTLDTGVRKSVYGKTRAEVQRKLTATQHDRDLGLPVVAERQTVGQYLTSWLEAIRPTVTETTHERYESDVRLHLLPRLGKIKLAKLTPQHVEAVLAGKLNANNDDDGLSPRSVRGIRAVLRHALNDALANGLVMRNAAALVRAPKAPRGEMHVYTPEQVRVFLRAAASDRLEALWVLAVTTGMRQGELLGLQWKQVNLEGKHLQVQTVLKRLRTGLVLRDTKTSGSRRKVALTDLAVAALRRHRTRQVEERLAAGEAWQDHDLVFSNTLGGYVFRSNFREDMYMRVLQQAGLPYIRFHDLRHTAATLMLLQGIHPKVVSEMLGHASVALTLSTYSHVLPDMQLTATAALDQLLG